jgi:hypothetical protein
MRLSKSRLFGLNVVVHNSILNIENWEQSTYSSDTASEFPIQPVGADVIAAAAALVSQHFKIPDGGPAPTTKELQTSGPVVKIPGPAGSQAPPLHSKHSGTSALTGGYTVNHLSYQATRSKMAKTAYAGNGGHVIVVEVRLVHMPVGKVKPFLIKVHFLLSFRVVLAENIVLGYSSSRR